MIAHDTDRRLGDDRLPTSRCIHRGSFQKVSSAKNAGTSLVKQDSPLPLCHYLLCVTAGWTGLVRCLSTLFVLSVSLALSVQSARLAASVGGSRMGLGLGYPRFYIIGPHYSPLRKTAHPPVSTTTRSTRMLGRTLSGRGACTVDKFSTFDDGFDIGLVVLLFYRLWIQHIALLHVHVQD